jgi:hypothetical protein
MRLLQKENFTLVIGTMLTLVLVAIHSQSAQAAFKPISCETNFGEKSFTIQGSDIAFHAEQDSGRSISSVSNSKTRKTHSGFNKTIYLDGDKHLIHIENEKNFNSNNDFLAVTSPKGHKMTYPINCNSLD